MTTITSGLVYPFDPTGRATSNKIVNEQHIITGINWRDYHFIVPRCAPFFVEGLKLRFIATDGEQRYLQLGVDWYPSHQFVGASRGCAKEVFGSVSFLNQALNGTILIEMYQSIGGVWVQDEVKISQILADRLHNPRISTWESVIDMPYSFPVIDHEWDLVDMVGEKEVVEALNGIENQLRSQGQEGLSLHIADKNNPHQTTKDHVQLGLVNNYGTANDSEAIAGTASNLYITPAGVKKQITAGVLADLTNHKNNNGNPHNTTAAQVGAYTIAQTNSLLDLKLDKNAAAVDTLLFDGLNPAQYKAYVLEGTSANAAKVFGLDLYALKLEIQGGASADTERFAGRLWDQAVAEILSGTSASTTRFGGKTAIEYAAFVQQGTSANSTLFDNRNFSQAKAEILAGTSAATATFGGEDYTSLMNRITAASVANSAKFGGLTPAQFKADILTSGATNANTLNGKTDTQIIAEALSGKAADSFKLEGKTLATIKSEIQSLTVANTLAFDGKTYAQFLNDIALGTASNSNKLENLSKDQIITEARSGTSVNSLKFDGRTFTEARNEILSGTASNADKLNGKTSTDITTDVLNSVGRTTVKGLTILAEEGNAPGFAYYPIGSIFIDETIASSAQENSLQVLIAGGDAFGAVSKSLLYLALNVSGSSLVGTVNYLEKPVNLANVGLGFTTSISGNIREYTICLKLLSNHDGVGVTLLGPNMSSGKGGRLPITTVNIGSQPAVWTAISINDSYTKDSQLVTLQTQVTNLSNSLTTLTGRVTATETVANAAATKTEHDGLDLQTSTALNSIVAGLDAITAQL